MYVFVYVLILSVLITLRLAVTWRMLANTLTATAAFGSKSSGKSTLKRLNNRYVRFEV